MDGPIASDAPQLPLVAVIGPTGSGKSSLALAIAEAFQGEVVNCDSLQVYRHFDIGTAKLPPSEWRDIPHHLIDIVNPDELYTAGEYARLARQTIASISVRARLPVVAGGTCMSGATTPSGASKGSVDPSLRFNRCTSSTFMGHAAPRANAR